jgi:hypothetical protein
VVPTAVIELEPSVTLTDATGATDTATDDVPLLPSLVAVMVVVPAATAVTNPF